MTYRASDFTVEMTLLTLQWAKYSAMATQMQAIATALGSDATTHDATIQAPPSALRIGRAQTPFTNDALLVVNKGKSGGVSNASMASIINTLASGGGPPPFTYPGAPLALYSMRQCGAGYAGKCVRVQRTSDNTQQDIGFAANGVIDMAAAAAFASGSLLFLAKWYDQSGAGLDLVQATAATSRS